MTNQEAIEILNTMLKDGRYLENGTHIPLEVLETFNKAIEALKNQTSKPLIIKCNRMLTSEEMEKFRQKWNSQKAANEVVILPYGLELAEANVELLEQIKTEIKQSQNLYYHDSKTDTYYDIIETNTVLKVIDNHIKELKGE